LNPRYEAFNERFRLPIVTTVVLDELISPELALVCPDLRAKAIAALPAPSLFARPPRPPREPLRLAPPSPVGGREVEAEPATLARHVGVYLVARAADLLAITAGIALFVLVFAAVAGIVRG
jgi:hypothetical protein